jgi:hypothetical protein
MRDDMNPFSTSPTPDASETPNAASPSGADVPASAPAEASGLSERPAASGVGDAALTAPAVMKFQSCRWRCSPEDGAFCTHRDVLPFAGKNDFKADSWCPECAFYKLRRTPKKREWVDRNAY